MLRTKNNSINGLSTCLNVCGSVATRMLPRMRSKGSELLVVWPSAPVEDDLLFICTHLAPKMILTASQRAEVMSWPLPLVIVSRKEPLLCIWVKLYKTTFLTSGGGLVRLDYFVEDSAEVMWVGVTDRWSVWRSNTR